MTPLQTPKKCSILEIGREGGEKIIFMKGFGQFAWWATVLGAVNWGLVGLLNINVVEMVAGGSAGVTQVVYVIIGAAGLYCLVQGFGKR